MCKIICIAGIKKENVPKLWEFSIASVEPMTEHDSHGFGYAAQGSKGVWGEKWLNVKEAFRERLKLTEKQQAMLGAGMAYGNKKFYKFGHADSEDIHAILIHSRMATCEKTIQNTHPFVSGHTALVHNGVIHNTENLVNKTSTCDSECILNSYVHHGVDKDYNAITHTAKELTGYYACGVLTKTSDGVQVMDVFKNTTANLIGAYIKELDTVVFCTKYSILETICKKLGWEISEALEVVAEKLMRINAVTGEIIGTQAFTQSSTYGTWKGVNSYPNNSRDAMGWEDYWKKEEKKTSPTTTGENNSTNDDVGTKDLIIDEDDGQISEEQVQKLMEDCQARQSEDDYITEMCNEANPFYVKGEGYTH